MMMRRTRSLPRRRARSKLVVVNYPHYRFSFFFCNKPNNIFATPNKIIIKKDEVIQKKKSPGPCSGATQMQRKEENRVFVLFVLCRCCSRGKSGPSWASHNDNGLHAHQPIDLSPSQPGPAPPSPALRTQSHESLLHARGGGAPSISQGRKQQGLDCER